MRTCPGTTPRHSEDYQLAPQVAAGEGEVYTVACIPSKSDVFHHNVMIFKKSKVFQGFPEISLKILALAPGALSRVGWLLVAPEEREEAERWWDRRARGRCRRPRAQKHARNVASVVPSDLYDDWRSLDRFLVRSP